MPKRSREAYDTPSSSSTSPPTKRAHVLAASSPGPRRPSSRFHTPSSFYSLKVPLTVPSDSPTNPFGLKRSLFAYDLPFPLSFRKHLALRFQLLNSEENLKGARSGDRKEREGVYRVVQVPRNYTFRHLHKLILFLFAADLEINQHKVSPSVSSEIPSKSTARRKTPRNASATSTQASKGKGKGRARTSSPAVTTWDGHYFETLKDVIIQRDSVRPGTIRPGAKVWRKLSSVRERRLFRDLFNVPLSAAEASSSAGTRPSFLDDEDDSEGENTGWQWEAEDDMTAGHVWPKGPTLDKAFIYHHSPTVSVHVTANTLPIVTRVGTGNTPFVFAAQGSAGSLIKVAHVTMDEHGNERGLSASDLEDRSMPTPELVPETTVAKWNEPDAFKDFLNAEADRERPLRRSISPFPELDDASSSYAHSDRLPSSSPGDSTTFPSSDDNDNDPTTIPAATTTSEPNFSAASSEIDVDLSAYSDSVLFPFAFSAITPYPAHPLRRRRVERAQRRLSTLTRSRLENAVSDDEEEAKKAKAGERERRERRDRARRRAPDWARMEKALKKRIAEFKDWTEHAKNEDGDGEDEYEDDWGPDPFGDEAEL